jgi:endonuclease/exonuclease/phosphatase family metal-dependent hydrolase
MALLVRSWNLFHGNAVPPERRAYLEQMVRLVTADNPDVVCLQELPVWSLRRLPDWSGGMTVVGDVAAPPRLGPLPSTAEVGRVLTESNHGLLRSALTGQANAILLAPRRRLVEHAQIALNARRFREAQAKWLELDPLVRLAWAKERRICQAARFELGDGRTAIVANLHASSLHADERVADAELRRAAVFVDALAAPDEPILMCGDFNIRPERSRTLGDLAQPDWGFSRPRPGIDQVLVRGLDAGKADAWPEERRRIDGRVVSDHAPVEVIVE